MKLLKLDWCHCLRLVSALSLAFALSACGSGASTEDLPNTGSAAASNYDGPAPSTSDVQNFKLNVWDNLVRDNRCGSCHIEGQQNPRFVRRDDINLAYAAANALVDLSDPSNSLLATKVGSGHNCWLASDSACADTIARYIQNWAGGAGGSQNEVVLRAPQLDDPGASKAFPADSSEFGNTVYPLLQTYCSNCHIEGQQTPFLGSDDVEVSYAAAKSRIDLETASASRLVQRLRNEFHNCWMGDCTSSSAEMQAQIQAFSDSITTATLDPNLVTSKALSLTEDGIAANTGGRYEDHVIALYEFKTGKGNIAYDTSGIEPALNLSLNGNVSWVGGWGLRVGSAYTDDDTGANIANGKAQGPTSASAKLYQQITATGEYSIEAWVVPNNVSQEDARIVSYSGSATARNFALSQTLYNYEILQRSSTTDQNQGFATADADERLQATLQHVVVTFAPGQARRIYVNGEYTGDADPDSAGLLNDWDNSFAFVLGNETDSNSLWQGTLRMVAIHNRALSAEQISQNYSVGVGEKFFLLFGVSHLIDVDEAFVVFEVSQFDSFSYLFSDPFFVSLSEGASYSNIELAGIKLGINGKEATVGQAYKNLSVTLNSTEEQDGRFNLSSAGTIIALEQGPDTDEFFLSFERIGRHENVVVEAAPPAPAAPADLPVAASIGLKTFDEVNASMAVVTGVSPANSAVQGTYNTIRQQLPSAENIEGFLSAHQMAVTQLAIQYCNALVEDPSLSASYFPGLDLNAAAASAFDTPAKRALLINPLMARMMGTNLTSQPNTIAVSDELSALITRLSACGNSCEAERTKTIVKASCAAVLGSAVTLVQ